MGYELLKPTDKINNSLLDFPLTHFIPILKYHKIVIGLEKFFDCNLYLSFTTTKLVECGEFL